MTPYPLSPALSGLVLGAPFWALTARTIALGAGPVTSWPAGLPPTRAEHRSRHGLRIGVIGGVVLAVVSDASLPRWRLADRWWGYGGGLVLAAAGIALLGSARARRDGAMVPTAGPYRVVRYPAYAGILLAASGLGLALDSWLSLLVGFAVPLVGLAYRIVVEERALDAALGVEYARHRDRAARLIPGVW